MTRVRSRRHFVRPFRAVRTCTLVNFAQSACASAFARYAGWSWRACRFLGQRTYQAQGQPNPGRFSGLSQEGCHLILDSGLRFPESRGNLLVTASQAKLSGDFSLCRSDRSGQLADVVDGHNLLHRNKKRGAWWSSKDRHGLRSLSKRAGNAPRSRTPLVVNLAYHRPFPDPPAAAG